MFVGSTVGEFLGVGTPDPCLVSALVHVSLGRGEGLQPPAPGRRKKIIEFLHGLPWPRESRRVSQ